VIVEPLLYASESLSHGQYYYTKDVRQVASLYQHNRKHRLAGQNIQQRAVGENWRRTSAGAAEEKKMELAWTHTEKKVTTSSPSKHYSGHIENLAVNVNVVDQNQYNSVKTGTLTIDGIAVLRRNTAHTERDILYVL